MSNYKKYLTYNYEIDKNPWGNYSLNLQFYFKGEKVYYVFFYSEWMYDGITKKESYFWKFIAHGPDEYYGFIDGLIDTLELSEWGCEISKTIILTDE